MIKPLNDNVVIKMVEAEEKSAGGIILTGTAKEQPEIAEVVEVGPGKMVDGKLVPVDVVKGDKVICSYTGKKVKLEGVEYRIVSQDDILAKIL